MKLNKLHLFLIVIGVLLLASLGFTVKEGLEDYEERLMEGGEMGMETDSDYVLKSSIVPPVCPRCPQATECPREKACPPCPRPKRCPESSFDCKKVPNYSSVNTGSNLPLPMLNSFSQF
jgi:hypothetical protein